MKPAREILRIESGDGDVASLFPRALRERDRRIAAAAAAAQRGLDGFAERSGALIDGLGRLERTRAGAVPARLAREPSPRSPMWTHAALRCLLERGLGVTPRLWPGLRFELGSSESPGREVRIVAARRSLAIVWDAADVERRLGDHTSTRSWLGGEGDPARNSARELVLRSVDSRLRPLGLRVQLAVLSRVPGNAYVNGLRADGEIVDAWD